MYQYGQLQIQKSMLIANLKTIGSGQYTTFDILKIYQGSVTRNSGIPAGRSWNANFGKILKMCEKDTNGSIISEIQSNKSITINGGATNTSVWEIK